MLEGLSNYFTEQGLLGVLVFLLMGVIVYLFRLLAKQWEVALQDRDEMVKALMSTSVSVAQQATAVEKTNEILRLLVSQRGNGSVDVL